MKTKGFLRKQNDSIDLLRFCNIFTWHLGGNHIALAFSVNSITLMIFGIYQSNLLQLNKCFYPILYLQITMSLLSWGCLLLGFVAHQSPAMASIYQFWQHVCCSSFFYWRDSSTLDYFHTYFRWSVECLAVGFVLKYSAGQGPIPAFI